MKSGPKKAATLLTFIVSGLLPKAIGQVPPSNNTTQDEIGGIRSQIENAAKDNDGTSLWYTAAKIDKLARKLKDKATLGGVGSEMRFQLLLQLLQVTDEAQAVDFDPSDWPAANIAPPIGKSGILYDSGISPESIKNPDDRKAYEAALAKNSVKTKRYSFQTDLIKLRASLMKHVEEFRNANFGFSEPDLVTLRNAVDKAITREALRSQLVQMLSLEKKP